MYCGSPRTHCAFDPGPTWIIKHCGCVLSPFIADIFNESITTGHSSTAWNTAVIKPLITKPGLNQREPANYRQVSNLPFPSKMIERMVPKKLRRIKCYPRQTCFRRSILPADHATSSSQPPYKYFSDVTDALDAGNIAMLTLLDLTIVCQLTK